MSTMQKRPLSQRQGLNCTLSYNHISHRSYRCRVEGLTWGVRPVMDEAAGRDRHTAYPHRVVPTPFQIVVVLNGYHEFTDFRDWMMEYAGFSYDSQLSDHGTDRTMTVAVPSRRFLRKGILATGISFGDHVGSMVWKIPYVFEATNNPLEKNSAARLSTYSFGTAAGLAPEMAYFYPFGKQLAGEQSGSDFTEPTGPQPEPDVAGAPSTTADIPPIASVPPGTGVKGDTISGNSVPGPTEKTIPETLRFRGRIGNDIITMKITSPPQAIKQDGAIIGYKYIEVVDRTTSGGGGYSVPVLYNVYSSGNVSTGGPVIGSVVS